MLKTKNTKFYDVIGAGLANTVLETLSILGLDLKKMRGQGYDGAATMRGQFRGVQASIKEKLPLALSDCSSHNQILFLSAIKEIAAKLDIKEEIPRACRLQTARNNVPDSTEEEYYRRAVYVAYLDDFCNSLKERFESHKETVASLQHILPEFFTKTDFYLLEAAFNFYEEYLSHKEVVQSEFMSWKEKWSQEKSENLPKTAISSLEKCDKTFFPNIYILLKLLAVVPVSVATVERSFSSLRKLKTYLRNTTSEKISFIFLAHVPDSNSNIVSWWPSGKISASRPEGSRPETRFHCRYGSHWAHCRVNHTQGPYVLPLVRCRSLERSSQLRYRSRLLTSSVPKYYSCCFKMGP
ncbi:hypothetical protein AVEN_223181-1 [Araneus ventricosus]|uniref:HAT C-terminal dimerisation domain-containing protein n=1 Tax=Araneus ventricosus TaxID=182803 RepID=A0A4Y2FRF0_ARAVE|nr:hypothetical protein AVEN_223181-1 [Araneus ventricosus]